MEIQKKMNPKYPIYIPSKGRYDSRLTSKALEAMKVPYYIVIEKQEYKQYSKVINPKKILILPFSNKGLVAARIWIMEHSINLGFERHWQLDDNIKEFYRLNKNTSIRVNSGTILKAAEDFTDRYENIAISGLQYFMFINDRAAMPPFYLNTRVYSCSLINNKIPYRHRRLYNDDTDICLCALKGGWCTILFNAFSCRKQQTMTMTGGNTEDLYLIQDGRLKMAESLMADHPDVTKISWKWGRWQHSVNYKPFIKKNKLKLKPGIKIKQGVDNYGMELQILKENKWTKMNF